MSKPVILLDAGQLVGLSGTADGDVLTWNGTAWVSSPGGGVGTVTSVALDAASTGLTVSGGTTQTITGSGTFTLGGTLGVANGGTGLSTVTEGSLLYASGADVLAAGTLSDLDWSTVTAPAGVELKSAAAQSAFFGAGNATDLTTANGGSVDLWSGDGASGGDTTIYGGYSYATVPAHKGGSVFVYGGNVEETGNINNPAGNIIIASGSQNVAGSTQRAGNVIIDTGTSELGGNDVRLGVTNAHRVQIGSSTNTTTINGALTLSDNALGPASGGTGLGAPPALDVGKVLTAKADGTYELATPASGSVTDVTASAPLASSGGATPDISLTGTVDAANGGTGLTAPAVGDVGKLLTATALGTYELATLPNVGTAGTYGSASSVPVLTTDAQGRVSAVTDTSIDISTAQVTGLDTALGTFALKTTTISAGTGLSGGGNLSANRTISMPSVGTAGTYGSASSVAVVTTDAQGRVSGATTTSIAVTQLQVSGLTTALAGKADKTVQLLSGTGIDVTGAGTLAGNNTISLKSEFPGQIDQGSATKTVTLSTDSYGRVTSITQQNIAGLAAGVITSGQLGIANGGTGLDTSSVLAGAVLMGQVGGGALALHKLSGDATMLGSGVLTVTGLQTNPVSATVLGEPDAGKALVWSGSEWQATNIQGGGGGGGLIYFMNYAASSPYPLSTVFDQNAGWNTGPIPVQNDATGTTLATFVTASGVPGIEVIPAGLWDVNFYAASDALANEVAVRFNVVTISGVTATVIATSDYVYLSDPAAVNNYIATVYVPATDVALTDRLQIVLEGRRFTGDARTITTYFGTGSITHAHTTINAPGGTGLVKVVDGFIQTPATLLVNADVSATAAVAVAKLAAGTNSYVLTTVAGVPTWQAPAVTGVTTLTGTGNQVLVNGGFGTPVSGAVTLTLPQAIDTSSGPTFSTLTLSTLADGILKATGGTGSIHSGFVSLTTEVGGVLPITKGGTNLTSSGASGNLLVSDGSAWASVAMAGDASILASGTITLANAGSAGTYGSASAVPVFVTDVKGRVTSVTNTSIAIGAGAITSGTLNTTRGGTGVSNPSTGTLLLGAGAGAMTSLSGTAGDTIIWSGSTWTASALSSNAVTSLAAGTGVSVSASTGAVTVSIGQSVATSASPSFAGLTLTGLTGYLKGNGASVVSASSTIPVADVTGAAPLASPTFTGTVTLPLTTAGYVKTTSGGVISSSATVAVADLSGAVSVPNGGTNNASLSVVQGTVYYGNGTQLVGLAPGTSGQFLQTQGASANPQWASVTTSAPYDLRGMFVGNPATSAVIDRFVADRAVTVSTTTTDHRFYCATLPASGTVVLTVYKTPLAGTGKVAMFTATYTTGGSATGNGLYAATIGVVADNTLIAGDLVTVEVGTTQAAFATPVWTISGTA